MNEVTKVKDYFTRAAKEFDNIYENRGGLITKLTNLVFRKGMRERYALVLQLCAAGDISVLDIGCGAGRFTVPLAERGMQVMGIDYSPEMIRMADTYVKARVKSTNEPLRISHACSDFLSDFSQDEKFDVTLAIGVLDYLKDPLPFLKKMKAVTRRRMIISFPSKYTPQMPIRKMWLATKDCPVYFYTRTRIVELCALAKISDYQIIPFTAGYLLKAEAHTH